MKKNLLNLLTLILLLLIVACNSSDDSIDDSQLLNDFQEPNLNFRITPTELEQQEGEANNNIGGEVYYYLNPQNGVTEYRYAFFNEFTTNDFFYGHVNVDIHANQENLDYIVNWLTVKYGTPEFNNNGDGSEGYEWFLNPQTDSELSNISIVYSSNGLETNETFLLDYSVF